MFLKISMWILVFFATSQIFHFQYFSIILVPAISITSQIKMPFEFLVSGKYNFRNRVNHEGAFFLDEWLNSVIDSNWAMISLVEIFLRISQKLSSIISFFNFLRNSGRVFRFLEKVLDCLRKLQNKKFDIQRKAEKVQISQNFFKKSPIFSRYLAFLPNPVRLRN